METPILLDTGESCFFCLKNSGFVEEDPFRILSLGNLFLYLGLKGIPDRHDHEGQSQSQRFQNPAASVCDVCTRVLHRFQDLFLDWLKIEMELGNCLGDIKTRLQTGNDSDLELNLAVRDTRKRLKEKCEQVTIIY